MFFQAHRVSLQTESSSEETCIVVKFISMAFSSLQSRFAQVFHFLGASFLEIFIRNQCQQMIGEKATIHGVSVQVPNVTIIFSFLFCYKRGGWRLEEKNSVDEII